MWGVAVAGAVAAQPGVKLGAPGGIGDQQTAHARGSASGSGSEGSGSTSSGAARQPGASASWGSRPHICPGPGAGTVTKEGVAGAGVGIDKGAAVSSATTCPGWRVGIAASDGGACRSPPCSSPSARAAASGAVSDPPCRGPKGGTEAWGSESTKSVRGGKGKDSGTCIGTDGAAVTGTEGGKVSNACTGADAGTKGPGEAERGAEGSTHSGAIRGAGQRGGMQAVTCGEAWGEGKEAGKMTR